MSTAGPERSPVGPPPGPLIAALAQELALRRGGVASGLKPPYLESLAAAGAVTVVVPPGSDPRRVLAAADGLLIPGGADIVPESYGAVTDPEAPLRPMPRPLEALYLTAAREALARDLPCLGICLGMQTINVALGGTLHQDLGAAGWDGAVHGGGGRGVATHGVRLESGSRLARWLRSSGGDVASEHHQGLDRLGSGLEVAARSPDGVLEAIEHPRARFLVGVGWHPERTADPALGQGVIAAFVAACARR